MEKDANFALNVGNNVFESSFRYWNDLPAHLKVQVLRNLSYPTLRSFMFLSKECMTLTSSVKTHAYDVHLLNEGSFAERGCFAHYSADVGSKEASATIIVYYKSSKTMGVPDSQNPYILTFVDVEGGGCVVKRRRNKRGRSVIISGVKYQNEKSSLAAMRVFFHLTKNIKAQYILIEMTSENVEIERLLEELTPVAPLICGRLTINAESKTLASSLLRFVSPGCELNIIFNLDPSEEIFLDSTFCDLEAVRQAPEFDTEAMVAVSDDQLCFLKARCLRIKAPHISSKGINRIIMQWLDNKRVIEEILLEHTQRINEIEVFEEVDKDRILSEVELSKIDQGFSRDSMRLVRFVGSLYAGMRNISGALILINIGTDFCELWNPYSNNLVMDS